METQSLYFRTEVTKILTRFDEQLTRLMAVAHCEEAAKVEQEIDNAYVHSIGNCIFPIATVPITQRYVGRLSVARYRPMRGGRGGERSPFFLI